MILPIPTVLLIAAQLAEQKEISLLFYDQDLRHRLNKRIGNGPQTVVRQILAAAEQLAAAIPTERYDFEQAKQRVQARTTL